MDDSSQGTNPLSKIRPQDLQDPGLNVLNRILKTIWNRVTALSGGSGPVTLSNTLIAPNITIPSQTTPPTDPSTVLTLGAAMQLFGTANQRQALLSGTFQTTPTSTQPVQPIPGP